jgi:hypothetical protein
MGGGGGSSTPAFKAVGTPPGFDYQNAVGANQMAVGGDIQSYALSDADFANRYPALQDAYNSWQANLGQQVGAVGAGQAGQQQVMAGLGSQILGRQADPTTSNITSMQNDAQSAASAVNPIYAAGAQQMAAANPIFGLAGQTAGLAAPITQLGSQQAGLAQPLMQMGRQQQQIGQSITGQGQQVAGMAATPYQLGQQLLNEPIDPQTQQQMQLAGLSSAAGALGAGSLGQGMAGQAAAARQLGLNTLQYGQAMRGEAMGDISQAASIAGQGGQLQGLGAQTIGAGGTTMGLGGQQLSQAGQLYGLGGNMMQAGGSMYGQGATTLGQGAQTYGLGAQTAGTAAGISGQAQAAQEQYATDTANMANIYGNLQNQQAQNLMLNMQTSGNLFAKRPFGLGGTNMAQTELGQAGAYNSFQQANYATMNGIAYNSSQMSAQQNQLQQQQSANMTGTLVGAGSSAAVAAGTTAALASAAACWVAREVLGTDTRKWQVFRHWLMNKASRRLRALYLTYGPSVAHQVRQNQALRALLQPLMDTVIEHTTYVCLSPA